MKKKIYQRPDIALVSEVAYTRPLAGSQGNWGDAKETGHAPDLWDDDETDEQGGSWLLDEGDLDWD